MGKRITSRAIIVDGDYVYAMYRRKKLENGSIREYYNIPGGGLEDGETLEENVIRELKEEFSVDIAILDYLGVDETDDGISHLYQCKIVDGIPTLGGEEKEKCCEDNYYEIKKVFIPELDKVDIFYREWITKAYFNQTLKK